MIVAHKVATWLEIATAQRQRQLTLFTRQFGPSSGAVKDTNNELLELDTLIKTLRSQPDTPIEQYIKDENKNKK